MLKQLLMPCGPPGEPQAILIHPAILLGFSAEKVAIHLIGNRVPESAYMLAMGAGRHCATLRGNDWGDLSDFNITLDQIEWCLRTVALTLSKCFNEEWRSRLTKPDLKDHLVALIRLAPERPSTWWWVGRHYLVVDLRPSKAMQALSKGLELAEEQRGAGPKGGGQGVEGVAEKWRLVYQVKATSVGRAYLHSLIRDRRIPNSDQVPVEPFRMHIEQLRILQAEETLDVPTTMDGLSRECAGCAVDSQIAQLTAEVEAKSKELLRRAEAAKHINKARPNGTRQLRHFNSAQEALPWMQMGLLTYGEAAASTFAKAIRVLYLADGMPVVGPHLTDLLQVVRIFMPSCPPGTGQPILSHAVTIFALTVEKIVSHVASLGAPEAMYMLAVSTGKNCMQLLQISWGDFSDLGITLDQIDWCLRTVALTLCRGLTDDWKAKLGKPNDMDHAHALMKLAPERPSTWWWLGRHYLAVDVQLPRAVEYLSKGLKLADEKMDEVYGACLAWDLAHAIIMGGKGPTFSSSEVRELCRKAKAFEEGAERWRLVYVVKLTSIGRAFVQSLNKQKLIPNGDMVPVQQFRTLQGVTQAAGGPTAIQRMSRQCAGCSGQVVQTAGTCSRCRKKHHWKEHKKDCVPAES
ncbi:hypothetical protein WJX72_004507 [[Myrmecia] bisecta]|uniref:MYND-type domain-containing protein n=1 Tax=[Myrmecia] bisecta TaxID=41462 RepID=A0AAW1PAC5_9CHLO